MKLSSYFILQDHLSNVTLCWIYNIDATGVVLGSLLLTLKYFIPCPVVCIVNFEQVNAGGIIMCSTQNHRCNNSSFRVSGFLSFRVKRAESLGEIFKISNRSSPNFASIIKEFKKVWYNCCAHHSAHHFILAISSQTIKRKKTWIIFLQYSCSVTMIKIVKRYF